ncbi:iron-containing redox enzyme family protein [Leeia aquatica]|uniref:3-oxoacyl-ACP synthase n=1 Tax=Leeia aquatica TaxID=2725557 RepID=A0A847SCD4_9NEIS|nr:iron-containing redox enzyme family protein [Leeia aquatica]NLR76565.1 3-oxoacyl-ACP synthase [Leeia aquatica]
MPTPFQRVYLDAASHYLPGEPVDNTAMDQYIAPLNRLSNRIKQRILAENGIEQRHYAINPQGETVQSHAAMAAEAIRRAVQQTELSLSDITLLAAGSSGGDALMPGFANLIQGELSAPPMETLSSQGVCASGVTALSHAAMALELGSHERALVVASELPSRMFKKSRFAPRDYHADFDAHFLRWMLSDGAGAMLLSRTPRTRNGIRLRLKWVHQRSFSGDYPVCMQLGLPQGGSKSFLDYDSCADAERDGALSLRQDIRLLPHLFDIGIHEYVKLVQEGWLHPDRVSHFLCHYSSERFIPVVEELMAKAQLSIPRERWYSNLKWRGNTGSASIFIMLAEFLETHTLQPGDTLFCYIPESGRFTTAFLLLEAEAADQPLPEPVAQPIAQPTRDAEVPAPHDPQHSDPRLARLLQALAVIWHDYRSRAWRTPMIRKLREQRFTWNDYRQWMACWIPQVREGSLWMREAVASLQAPFEALGELVTEHANDEQFDFNILFQDYQAAGGEARRIEDLRRNAGGEALNSYMHALASTPNPIGLLGAIYIIEGTGQRIIPALLPLLKNQLQLPPNTYRFLDYHGSNDEHHLQRWLRAVMLALQAEPGERVAEQIIRTTERTAQLYLMQFEHVLEDVDA